MHTRDGRVVPVESVRAMDARSLEGRSKLTGEELPGRVETEMHVYLDGQVVDPKVAGITLSARPEPAAEPLVAMEYNPQRWIEEKCAFWQRQLRLQDWKIQVVRATALEMAGKSGLTWAEGSVKEAKIHVLMREEWPAASQSYGAWDEELFLVHELMHLHLLAWESGAEREKNPREFEAKEMAIDLTAMALVKLARGEVR